jgi:hypothetical protein
VRWICRIISRDFAATLLGWWLFGDLIGDAEMGN